MFAYTGHLPTTVTPDLPSSFGPSLGWVRGQLQAQRVFYGDSSGKAPAIRRPITGSLKVSRFLVGLARRGQPFRVRFEPAVANAQPAVCVLDADGALLGVIGLDIADGHVVARRNQINPTSWRTLRRSVTSPR